MCIEGEIGMMPSEKITGTQLGLLLYSFVAPTILLRIPTGMVGFAKQNAWISVLPATLTGLLSIWVMTILANRYPGLTIIEYSSKIIGKWLGKCVGFYYVFYWFTFVSVIAIEHIGFINTVLLPNSPSFIVIVTLLIICGFAVSLGIEVIARSNEFLSILIIVFFIPLLFLMLGRSDFGQLKPIFNKGILPVLQGSLFPASFMSQFFILGWLLPYLNQPNKARKISLNALLGTSILVIAVVLPTIMVLGPLTAKLNFPILSVIQYIGIEGSFERLEAISVSIWVLGIFIKLSVALFIFCLCVSQSFGIQNHREYIIPLTLLTLIGSFWIFKNGTDLHYYLTFTYPSLAFLTQNIIPLMLLVIDSIKRIGNKSLL
ncbi:MAG: hypothetical protein K0Q73_2803 [Paenibacillus sp.]|nr:hypothetical protein [Paenibacillus sp.]